MDWKDLVLTPIYLFFIYLFLHLYVRRLPKKDPLKKYFIPAVSLKIAGAVMLGIIYQFYYGGGDTYNYFEGGQELYNLIIDNPLVGIKILFSDINYDSSLYQYVHNIRWYKSPAEFLVIKISTIAGLFCFHTYSVIAIFFALASMTGMVKLYRVFSRELPYYKKEIIIAIFFIPSVFFWGSGIMKDSIVLGAMGWCVYSFYNIFILKRKIMFSVFTLLVSFYLLQAVKLYVLLVLAPALIYWLINLHFHKIKNKVVRVLLKPAFLILSGIIVFLSIKFIGQYSPAYQLSNITQTAYINYDYLANYVESGSAYQIETMDGTLWGFLKSMPEALIISWFRPTFISADNVLMFFAAIENTFIIILFVLSLWQLGPLKWINTIRTNTFLNICLFISIFMGIGIGLTSGDFGSLVRYRIVFMPFFLTFLLILYKKGKGLKGTKKQTFH